MDLNYEWNIEDLLLVIRVVAFEVKTPKTLGRSASTDCELIIGDDRNSTPKIHRKKKTPTTIIFHMNEHNDKFLPSQWNYYAESYSAKI